MIVTGKAGDLAVAARPPQPYAAYSSLLADTFAGRNVTPEGALAIAHVYGAVKIVSQDVGKLPLEVIDEGSVTRSVVKGRRIASMLRWQPNVDMTAIVVWALVTVHLMLRGNAYLAKIRDATGSVVELVPIHPQFVFPFRDETGRKLFRVLSMRGGSMVDRIFDSSQILHIVGHSIDDGLIGASPIAVVRNRLGIQLAQSEAQGRFYAQGMHAKGILTTPQSNLSPEAVDRIKAQWEQANHGIDNAGRIPLLHSGITYAPVSMSLQDAQFIETMRWGATEIATLFGLQASSLNADSGQGSVRYANVGQDEVLHVKRAIAPPCTFIEQALNADVDLFGAYSRWVPRFNMSEALRADDKTRFEGYAIATGQQPWMGTQEVRDIEGLGPGGPPPNDQGGSSGVGAA